MNGAMNKGAQRLRAMAGVVALAALVAGGAGPAAAKSSISVELAPGVAVPVGSYLTTRGSGIDQTIDSGTGFGMGLHLVLDGWEVRYALSVLPTKSVELELAPDIVDEWNAFAEGAGLGELALIPNTVDGGVSSQSSGDALSIHHVNLGYRIPLLSGPVELYLPVGLGTSITTSSSDLLSRDLWGFSANAGIGVNYALFDWLLLGGSVRYLFTITEVDANVALVAKISSTGFTSDLIDDAYNIGHLIHVTASAAIRF